MGRPSSTNSTSGNSGTPQTTINNNELNDNVEKISSNQKESNRIEHIWGDKNLKKHHLDELLNEYHGDKVAAYHDLDSKIQDLVSKKNVKDGLITDTISFKGHKITFTGNVINGTYYPGTYYITEEDLKNDS